MAFINGLCWFLDISSDTFDNSLYKKNLKIFPVLLLLVWDTFSLLSIVANLALRQLMNWDTIWEYGLIIIGAPIGLAVFLIPNLTQNIKLRSAAFSRNSILIKYQSIGQFSLPILLIVFIGLAILFGYSFRI